MISHLEAVVRKIVQEELDKWDADWDKRRAAWEQKQAAAKADPNATGATATNSGWKDMPSFQRLSGSKKYTINVGDLVTVLGEGRGGGKSRNWTVLRIQVNDSTNLINVEVRKGLTHARTFRSDKIIYQRQKKDGNA